MADQKKWPVNSVWKREEGKSSRKVIRVTDDTVTFTSDAYGNQKFVVMTHEWERWVNSAERIS